VSAGQVSAGVGISLNVQIDPETAELVRCTNCHCLYEPAQARETAPLADGCPECGGTAWLAVRVPVDPTNTSFEQ
jgi:PHP family Zn ribbon phosphoesterase